MTKRKKVSQTRDAEEKQISGKEVLKDEFDDVLRRLLESPPQPIKKKTGKANKASPK